jgi:hypothetical protein
MEYIKQLKDNNFINSKNRIINPQNLMTKIDKSLKECRNITNEIKENIIKRSTFLDGYTDNISYRIRCLSDGKINLDDCLCPVCKKLKKPSYYKENKLFAETCGSRDKIHKIYMSQILTKKQHENWQKITPEKIKIKQEKYKQTMLKKYGVENPMYKSMFTNKLRETHKHRSKEENFKSLRKRRQSSLKKYGFISPNQKHYNTDYKLLSKKYIENNFIDIDGYIMIKRLCEFIGCKDSAAYRILHRFDVSYKIRSNFNPNKKAILYYLYDPQEELYKIGITNKDTSSRFGAGFIKERGIRILMEESYSRGEQAFLAEQEILHAFESSRTTNPTWPEALGGKTEFFNRNILEL